MIRTVYEGENRGLYEYASFELWIESIGGTRTSRSDDDHDLYVKYHLSSQNVTVNYYCEFLHVGKPGSVSIMVDGTEKDISKVEAILLEEARKQRLSHVKS